MFIHTGCRYTELVNGNGLIAKYTLHSLEPLVSEGPFAI